MKRAIFGVVQGLAGLMFVLQSLGTVVGLIGWVAGYEPPPNNQFAIPLDTELMEIVVLLVLVAIKLSLLALLYRWARGGRQRAMAVTA
jgi:hypothetical protein